MGRTIYFYTATALLFCCFAFCFFLLAFKFEKNQIFGIDISNDKESGAFKFLYKNLIARLIVITAFYLLPTLFFIRYFSCANKMYPLISILLMLSSYSLFFLDSKNKVLNLQTKTFLAEKEKDFVSLIFSVIFIIPFIPVIFSGIEFIVGFDKMPALIASHWKISGKIDSYTAKTAIHLCIIMIAELLILVLFPLFKKVFLFKKKKIKAGNGVRKIKIMLLNIQMWGFSIFFATLNGSILNSRSFGTHFFLFFIGIEITILFLMICLNLFSGRRK